MRSATARATWIALGAAIVPPLVEIELARAGPLVITTGELAILGALAFVAWARRDALREVLARAPQVAWNALAWAAVLLAAALLGPVVGPSLEAWARLAGSLALFAALAALVVTPEGARAARRLVFWTGVALAALALLEYALPALAKPLLDRVRETGPFDYAPRARAVLAHPNVLGAWCAAAALTGLGLWRERLLGPRAALGGLGALLLAIAVSGSRTTWLCAGAGLALDAALNPRWRTAPLAASTALVGVVLLFDVSRYQLLAPRRAPPPTTREEAEAIVRAAYWAVLRRDADSDGLAFYSARVADGRLDSARLEDDLYLSAEYRERFGFPWAAAARRRAASWDSQESRTGRIVLWKAALGIFVERPLLGSGPGSYRLLSPAHIGGRYGEMAYLNDAHSLLLQSLAEGGVLGTLALGALLFALLQRARRSRAALAASVPLWVALGSQLFDFFLPFWEFAGLFWLLAALVAAAPHEEAR